MSSKLELYKQASSPLPSNIDTWYLYGQGIENFGHEGRHESVPMPSYGPGELLLRIDAVGICFSDIKVIAKGDQHPRLIGRDLRKDPVTLGHEASVTVVGIGADLADKFNIGQRFIVQADVFYKGRSMAFGYVLPGAQSQYQVVGTEVLSGDDGCYLLPVQDSTGYAEIALVEPWACVVASYRINRRIAPLAGGVMWIIGLSEGKYSLGMELQCKTVIATGVSGEILDEIKSQAASAGFEIIVTPPLADTDIDGLAKTYGGFDDIVFLGADPDAIEKATAYLKPNGIAVIAASKQLGRPVKVDIGKIHYQNHSFLGTKGASIADAYGPLRVPSELKSNGAAWFIGAGGPLGQMHVQRALEKAEHPSRIIVTDVDTARLEGLRQRFSSVAEQRGIELQVLNPLEIENDEFTNRLVEFTGGKGFDDIVILAPVPALVEQAVSHAGDSCLVNIFAGVSIGTIAQFDLSAVYDRGVRFVGSSGSKITDMQDTLTEVESGRLSTNTSVAAIGGIEASYEGMKATETGRFFGRVVIYPQIHGLGLTPLADLKEKLPRVHANLTNGLFWSREAETELLDLMLEG